MANEESSDKVIYAKPELKVWGKIEDITQTGSPDAPPDAKGGSVQHSQGI